MLPLTKKEKQLIESLDLPNDRECDRVDDASYLPTARGDLHAAIVLSGQLDGHTAQLASRRAATDRDLARIQESRASLELVVERLVDEVALLESRAHAARDDLASAVLSFRSTYQAWAGCIDRSRALLERAVGAQELHDGNARTIALWKDCDDFDTRLASQAAQLAADLSVHDRAAVEEEEAADEAVVERLALSKCAAIERELESLYLQPSNTAGTAGTDADTDADPATDAAALKREVNALMADLPDACRLWASSTFGARLRASRASARAAAAEGLRNRAESLNGAAMRALARRVALAQLPESEAERRSERLRLLRDLVQRQDADVARLAAGLTVHQQQQQQQLLEKQKTSSVAESKHDQPLVTHRSTQAALVDAVEHDVATASLEACASMVLYLSKYMLTLMYRQTAVMAMDGAVRSHDTLSARHLIDPVLRQDIECELGAFESATESLSKTDAARTALEVGPLVSSFSRYSASQALRTAAR